MPKGPGTYGTQKGRPPKKKKGMKPIVEEPLRPGLVGWLMGSSMTEEDADSDCDDDELKIGDLCVLGSGLALATAGVLLAVKARTT